MPQFRYVTPIKRGRWRNSVSEAWDAAANARVAHRDENGKVWLDPLTTIEKRKD